MRVLKIPAQPARTIKVPDDDPRTNAYFICEALHVSQSEVARVAGLSTPSVTVMFKGQASASARVKVATVKALAEAGFKFTEDQLFDPAMDAERLRQRKLATVKRRLAELEES
jgi:transcriptional regulator with XRE-family HTH domain